MSEIKVQNAEVFETLPQIPEKEIKADYNGAIKTLDRVVVVLDDDPTGIQTVNDVPVYTGWEYETILDGFKTSKRMFYILTNSRGLTVNKTRELHALIAERIQKASEESGRDYILVSRADSTLRGHYPLETETLKSVIEEKSGKKFTAEVLCFFFTEGGRYTFDNVHYVKSEDILTPAGMTEFAKDKSFHYVSSDLTDWVEEKTEGRVKKGDVAVISLAELRSRDYDGIYKKITSVKDFGKIVINATSYSDLESFCVPFIKAVNNGYNYIFRTASAWPKVIGNVKDKPLLTRDELVPDGNRNGGIVVIGSHVNKTTSQLNELKNTKYHVEFIEFNQHLVLKEGGLEGETKRVCDAANDLIKKGHSVVVYTRRDRIDFGTDDPDKQLELSVRISNAVTGVVSGLTAKPSFIIAKGGITSSEIGTVALKVKKANALGQIRPGVPVWQTGEESKFPFLPYIIFPGNVGTADDLRLAVELFMAK